MKFRACCTTMILMAAACWAGAEERLSLHESRHSPHDLALTGRISGLAQGEIRYVRWEDLRALPIVRLKVEGEFVKGEQEITALFLDELLKRLPLAEGADTVLASCTDRYASVYTLDFIKRYRPFLVLEIDGAGPERWPPPGLNYNPGPYVVTVSEKVAPGVASLLDVNHKRPWGTVELEIASYADRFRPIHTGRWSDLSPAAREGREIWVNSCTSCHQGPDGLWGGNKSERPFLVLEALAGYNPDYFKTYVRTPRAVNAAAKMEPHPHYTDKQLEALIAFVTADRKR